MSKLAHLLVVASLTTPAAVGAQHGAHPASPDAGTVQVYDDLGDHGYAITTTEPLAQTYFDQGLRLYYAFNHADAIRSFRAAQNADPVCAMCWWGEALAWGPNINLPMDSASAVSAFAAIERARAVAGGASERERALIAALATRYEAVPSGDRAHLDAAYAHAMGQVVERHPADREAIVLYGESLMDLRPWDYWTEDGRPHPGIEEALAGFEHVLAENADHPGACHFFIHAVEKVYPERAVPCAERLAGLMPGAGHIVHMPGHIYIRVGRYLEAVEANRHAVHADESYIRDQQPGMDAYTAGYYPHNYDFLAFAASMIGRRTDAVEAAESVARLIPDEMFGVPGMDFLQHWSVRPLQLHVRFEQWDEIVALPAPAPGRPHAQALWHYARGRAYAGTGDVANAENELAGLRAVAAGAGLDGVRMEFNQSGDLLAIAEHVLKGWIAVVSGDLDQAIATLEVAVQLEDDLLYGEPPEWTVPVRHDLGAVLLRAGRASEAERVYRESLDHFPRNGWALNGLAAALRDQGRVSEADEIDAEFRNAWATADVVLERGVVRH